MAPKLDSLKAAFWAQFYRHVSVCMTNGKNLCAYVHIQPPYTIIHTVYIVPVVSFQRMSID